MSKIKGVGKIILGSAIEKHCRSKGIIESPLDFNPLLKVKLRKKGRNLLEKGYNEVIQKKK